MYRVSVPAPTVTPAAVGDGSYHGLTNQAAPDLALEVAGGCAAQADGPVDANTWWSTHWSESWELSPNADGTVRIYDACFGYGGTQEHGTLTAPAVQGGTVTAINAFDPSNARQKWRVTQSAGGVLTITNVATGLVLATGGTTAGSAIALVTANPADPAQGWTLAN